MSATRKRDLTLDLLRGGGVFYIVAYYHIPEVWMVNMPAGLSAWLARVALALFCFISGLLLATGNTVESWEDAGRFYRKRVLRIYPLYLLALIGFVAAGIVWPGDFWSAALLLNTVLGKNLLTLWFVCMIFVFYVVTPLFLYRRSVGRTCLLAGVVLVGAIAANKMWQWVDARFLVNFPAFVLGILLTQLPGWRKNLLTPSAGVVVGSALATGVLAWKTYAVYPVDFETTTEWLVLAWFLASLPVLFAMGRWLTERVPVAPARFLATASFALYLIHRLVYKIGEHWRPGEGTWALNAYYTLVLLPVALILAWGVQVGYDALLGKIISQNRDRNSGILASGER